jgi:hypothetical protein
MNFSVIADIDSIIDNSSDDLVNSTKGIEQRVFETIMQELQRFRGADGTLQLSDDAIVALNEINIKVKNAIAESGYQETVITYLRNFDTLNTLKQGLYNNYDLTRLNLSDVRQAAVRITANNMIGSGLDANFINLVESIIFEYAASGGTITDAEAQLRQFILGDEERLGHLERYAGQIARDSISQYDGLINAKIAKEFEMDGIMYVGSLIDDSRPQCKRWVEKGTIAIADLPKEIEWAEKNGTGWIQGTTVDTFLPNRGGHRCRHRAIPVMLTDVP